MTYLDWQEEVAVFREAVMSNQTTDQQMEYLLRGICLLASVVIQDDPKYKQCVLDDFRTCHVAITQRMGVSWVCRHLIVFSTHGMRDHAPPLAFPASKVA